MRLSFSEAEGAHLGNRDFAFAYDGLDRLIESDRGNASTWGQAGTQDWTLDMLGNWATFRWDKNGDGDFADGSETDVRAHNSANEIDDRTLEYPSPVPDVNAPVTYDDAGNVRLRYETGTTRLELTHDAWNRLVKVRRITGNIEDPPLDVSRHEYNGLHWRIMSVEDTDTPRDGELDQRRAYFYSASWQVLEEWVEVAHDPDPYEEGLISDYRMQQFWGLRHMDDAVMLRRQEETGEDAGDFTRASFQLTDRQFSVVAVVDESGMLMERVTYDPYGRAQHRWPGDFNGDGYADSTDTGALAWYEQIGDVDYRADHDLDRSGQIDLDDLIIAVAEWSGRGPLTGGQISDPEGPANRVGYAGYRFEPSSALYHVRFRWYDTGLGRWMERDPAGYVNGANTYQYTMANPITLRDSLGLGAEPASDCSADPSCDRFSRIATALKNRCPQTVSRLLNGAGSASGNGLAFNRQSGVPAAAGIGATVIGVAAARQERLGSRANGMTEIAPRVHTRVPPAQEVMGRTVNGAVGGAGAVLSAYSFALDTSDAMMAHAMGNDSQALTLGLSAAGTAVTAIAEPIVVGAAVAAGAGGLAVAFTVAVPVVGGVAIAVAADAAIKTDAAVSGALQAGYDPETNGTCSFLLSQAAQNFKACQASKK